MGVGHNPVRLLGLPLGSRSVRCHLQEGVQHGSRFGMRCWTLDRGPQVHLLCRVHHQEHWLGGPVATMSSGAPVAWSREIWWRFRNARKRQRWAGISSLNEVRSARAMRALKAFQVAAVGSVASESHQGIFSTARGSKDACFRCPHAAAPCCDATVLGCNEGAVTSVHRNSEWTSHLSTVDRRKQDHNAREEQCLHHHAV